MRALIQRVGRARVRTSEGVVGTMGHGLLALAAAGSHDGPEEARRLAGKIAALRIFPDQAGRMQHDVGEARGGVLLVSQFTLYGDTRRGNRPSFSGAAPPGQAAPLIDELARELRARGITVAQGRFGAAMELEVLLDGPVTIWLDAEPR